jgi:hypothetical protein
LNSGSGLRPTGVGPDSRSHVKTRREQVRAARPEA